MNDQSRDSSSSETSLITFQILCGKRHRTFLCIRKQSFSAMHHILETVFQVIILILLVQGAIESHCGTLQAMKTVEK